SSLFLLFGEIKASASVFRAASLTTPQGGGFTARRLNRIGMHTSPNSPSLKPKRRAIASSSGRSMVVGSPNQAELRAFWLDRHSTRGSGRCFGGTFAAAWSHESVRRNATAFGS